MLPKQDYYALLGLTRDASSEEIKRAYFEAAQKLHPDKNTAAGETELFLGVQQAYEVLSNPARRKQYDATLPPEEKLILPYTHHVIYSRPNLVQLDEAQMIYFILELGPPDEARPLHALDQDSNRPVGQLQKLHRGSDDSQVVKRIPVGIVLGRIELGDQEQLFLGGHGGFQRRDRFLAADKQRNDSLWKYDDVAQRQDREKACHTRHIWAAGC